MQLIGCDIMKRSDIQSTPRGIKEVKDLQLIEQHCMVMKDGSLSIRWGWNNGLCKQFFVTQKEIKRDRGWISRYSEGLMK